jgi:dolichyl-phosphate-mannose-protein mannosyltransferase
MLDGIQVFFMLGALLYFLHIYNNKYFFSKNYFILGLLVGLPVSVKYNGLAFCLLFVYLIFTEYGKKIIKFNFDIAMIKDFFIKTTLSVSGILLILFGSYYAHFSIGKYVVKDRYYWASPQYKDILARNETANPLHFPVMMRDTIQKLFFSKGVRSFKTNVKEKTASHPYGWPFMKKSIRYRWAKKGEIAQYLYLQGNPLIWYTGLSAIIVSFFLFMYFSFFKKKRESFNKLYKLIGIFIGLYLFYMIAALKIKRILYLYHYLIPLIFTLLLSYILFTGLLKNYIQDDNKYIKSGVIFFFITVMVTFIFFSPLTYYLPLTYDQFMKRVWLDIWGLVPVR